MRDIELRGVSRDREKFDAEVGEDAVGGEDDDNGRREGCDDCRGGATMNIVCVQ